MLFKAFERHQYYHMKDLITLTQQPHVSYTTFTALQIFLVFSLPKLQIWNASELMSSNLRQAFYFPRVRNH